MILRLWVRILSNILDGNGVKAMPESKPIPNSGSKMTIKRKIKVAKWGTPTKKCKRVYKIAS